MSLKYALIRTPSFVEDYREFIAYLAEFDEALAVRHFQRFEEALLEILTGAPYRHAFFKETGPPYRAKLFRVGKRTFWIIYSVEGDAITLWRFWDSARRPRTHGLAR